MRFVKLAAIPRSDLYGTAALKCQNSWPKQMKYRPKVHYMRKQPDITDGMRTILVDWLVEVGEEYKLRTETLYLAVNFLDRFLSCMSVLRGKLQLVGTAAMLLAS